MVNLIQDDYGSDMNFTITDEDSAALDLTSNTAILLKIAIPESSTGLLSTSCSVVSATAGTCKYTIQDGDFPTVGTYDYEIEVSYSGKVITSKPTDQIKVKTQLP